MKSIAAFALFICALPCMARISVTNTSKDAGCPIALDPLLWPGDGVARRYQIYYRNKTDKVVIGANFGLEMMDAVGDFSPYLTDFTLAGKTKPTKQNGGDFTVYTNGAKIIGYRLYVKKVAFADGSTWVDAGTKTCQYTQDARDK
jgi:hypothetical protein